MNKYSKTGKLITNVRVLAIAAVGLLILATGVLAACGGDGGTPNETPTDDGADAHVGDDDTDAGAYLEAAPKDELYLVEMTNFAFTPDVLEVGAGQVIEIAFDNVDIGVHDFTIDVIDADVHVSYLAGSGEHAHEDPQLDADVHFALTEPGSGVVHLKIHEPGEYVFYCSVAGHRESGMEGTLIVR